MLNLQNRSLVQVLSEQRNAWKLWIRVIIHFSRTGHVHRQGVVIVMKKDIGKRKNHKYWPWYTKCYCHYFPNVTSYSDHDLDSFYDQIQQKISALPIARKYINLGDFNAKVVKDAYLNWPSAAGRFGIGQANNRDGKML